MVIRNVCDIPYSESAAAILTYNMFNSGRYMSSGII